MRISSWITRFINNCQKIKKKGSLTTSEIQFHKKFHIKREPRKTEHSEQFEESRKQLNIQLDCESIYDCGGRSAFTQYTYHQAQH